VRYALKSMRNENILARQALPIEGESSFLDLATKLAYGADSVPYRSKRVSCPAQHLVRT